MINICDMARGMTNIKNFYGCDPIEIIKINLNFAYTAEVLLNNDDKWEIGYAGQVKLIKR